MTKPRTYRILAVVALTFSALVGGVGLTPVAAQTAAVKGSAFGYQSSISLFGGPPADRGPAPTVTLPAAGSATPITASAPTGDARYGPGIFFTSDKIDVSTQGTPGGTVTSSTNITNVNKSGVETFTASAVTSKCTASASGVTGETTITGGKLQIDDGSAAAGDEKFVDIPANPAPNTSFDGKLQSVGDTFRYIFNEQIKNPDGSITVNAAHQVAIGPTAKGDLYIGQSVCGATGSGGGATTTTAAGGGATTTTAAGGATTTTAAGGGATTTTAAAGGATTTTEATMTAAQTGTTTTTAAGGATTTTAAGGGGGQVGGGAFGYQSRISLFGGPAEQRGPAPTVTLPAAGSATPITASAPTGDARYGPGIFFTSDKIDVSTQGTPGGTVTSSTNITNVNKSGVETFTASAVTSKCTASASGVTGETTITGGKLQIDDGTAAAGDEKFVDIPANPAPNTSFDGKLQSVGDTFRYIFNEQIKNPDGSITVNAAHQVAIGPTAKGDLYIGQARCSLNASGGGTGTGGGGAGGGGGGLAKTGMAGAALAALAMALIAAGSEVTSWGDRLRGAARGRPWPRRGLPG